MKRLANIKVKILQLSNGRSLRLNDPRRFGCVLFQPGDVYEHKLLRHLGVEPLGNEFSGALLHRASRKRRVAVKNLLMDGRIVVGVGNIYASEALFRAGIRPGMAAGRVPAHAYEDLATAVRAVLAYAVQRGGTTLRDFLDPDGQPGYFAQNGVGRHCYGLDLQAEDGVEVRRVPMHPLHNYFDGYYSINEQYPLPDPNDFNTDGVPGLSPDEQIAFEDAYEEARRLSELAGIEQWANSSVMDYTPEWYMRIQEFRRGGQDYKITHDF